MMLAGVAVHDRQAEVGKHTGLPRALAEEPACVLCSAGSRGWSRWIDYRHQLEGLTPGVLAQSLRHFLKHFAQRPGQAREEDQVVVWDGFPPIAVK